MLLRQINKSNKQRAKGEKQNYFQLTQIVLTYYKILLVIRLP